MKIITKKRPEKRLTSSKYQRAGRDRTGRIAIRHRGGGEKKLLRIIDWKRNKHDIEAWVSAIEYDPNRGANLALLIYKDGEKRYIIAPFGLKVGDRVVTGEKVEPKVGNCTSLAKIPIGLPIHNIELHPGRGAQLVRGAGTSATILSKENGYAQVRMPSGELRLIPAKSWATIGQVGNIDLKTKKLGKAGKKRHLGIRPAVRGVAMHPGAHPHGGGEGRSGIGMPSPKSPWGKKTLGKKTRKEKKYSDKYIIKRRK